MWVYVVICILLVYCIIKERQALGCKGWVWQDIDCDNGDGKAVKGSAPSEGESSKEVLDKIDYASEYHERFVKWRVFIIVSFVAAMMMWFILRREIPPEWELSVIMLVLFLSMLLACNFYKHHLYNKIKENINKGTEILRKRI